MSFRGGLKVIVILVLSFIFNIESANARDMACIPKDHSGVVDSGLGNVVDNLVGVITNQIFGRIKGMNQANIFAYNNLDYGDRVWEEGMVYRIFMSIITDSRFQIIFYLSVILLCAFLGMSFALGYSQISTSTLVVQFVKIAVVVFFLTPAGWETYLELVVKNVIVAARYFNKAIVASMYNVPYSSVTTPFAPIDMVIGVLISGATWSKVLSLFFANGFLFTALLIVILGYVILTLLVVLMKTTILYATLLVISSVLLALGPIFAVCLLFDKTKEYFSKWVTNLIGLFMQQYILFLGLFLFCVMISAMLKGIFFFETCWGSAINLHLTVYTPAFLIAIMDSILSFVNGFLGIFGVKLPNPIPPILIDKKISLLSAYVINAEFAKIPSNIFSASGIAVLGMLLSKFTDGVTNLGAELAGSDLKATEVAKPMMEGMTAIQSHIDSGAGKAAFAAGSGQMLFKASRLVHKAQSKLDASIAKRVADGKTGWFTKGLKVASKTLSPGAFASKHIVQTTERKEEIKAMAENQRMARKFIDEISKEYYGPEPGKAHKNISGLTKAEKEDIRKRAVEYIEKNGKGIGGKPPSHELAERSLQSKIVNVNPFSPTRQLGENLEFTDSHLHGTGYVKDKVSKAFRHTFVDEVNPSVIASAAKRELKRPLRFIKNAIFNGKKKP
jgi:type IV secretory pathway VirB6-like protein